MKQRFRTLLAGFLESAEKFPDRPALEVEKQTFSYRGLLGIASSCAAALDAHSSGNEPPLTAVFASRSLYQFAGIIAALLRGHGYVPLNRSYPPERTQFMIRQTGCRSIVVDRESSKQLEAVLKGIEYPLVIALPEIADITEFKKAFAIHTFLGAEDFHPAGSYAVKTPDQNSIAYLIFTSGSTGVPKGVMVTHRNIRTLLDFFVPRFEITEHDRLSQTFAVTFDPSVLDMFLGWERGACCCCPSQQALLNPGAYINKSRITVWISVPSVAIFMKRLGSLKKNNLQTLRFSGFGGESLPVSIVRDWMEAAPNSAIENLYGPTELTIIATHYRWDSEKSMRECRGGTVPIGYPVPGLSALICDENLNEVSPGEEGELLMAGPQVTRGYIKEPEKTKNAYVVPPGRKDVYYRTGDLVRKPEPGEPICIIGRIDFQLKILGHRVELGEVEAAIREEAGIQGVAAIGWPRTVSGADGIEVFIEGEPFDAAEVKRKIAERLPEYMVPKKFHRISKIPLNENGKHDRLALQRILEADA